jgi:hypothetical protein
MQVLMQVLMRATLRPMIAKSVDAGFKSATTVDTFGDHDGWSTGGWGYPPAADNPHRVGPTVLTQRHTTIQKVTLLRPWLRNARDLRRPKLSGIALWCRRTGG